MGQYLNSAMSGFSSEFPESEDPSGVESNSEEFWSPNFNRQRGQDELRVNREYMNTKRSLLRYGDSWMVFRLQTMPLLVE